MAKKTPPPGGAAGPRPKRRLVELDADLARKIGVIAGALEISVPDWVNNRLRPIVQEELRRVLKELQEDD